MKKQLRVIREKELLRIAGEHDNEANDGKTTINNIKGAFALYERPPDAESVARLQFSMSNAMAMNQNQYNCYFAFEPEYSEKYSQRPTYVMTVKKDVHLLSTDRYGDPENRIMESWPDPAYQRSEDEVWYHIGKKSRRFEVSPIYFDSSYVKMWMFTIGFGLSIVRIIVEKHGGTISAQSDAGSGAAFLIDFPVHETGAGGGGRE